MPGGGFGGFAAVSAVSAVPAVPGGSAGSVKSECGQVTHRDKAEDREPYAEACRRDDQGPEDAFQKILVEADGVGFFSFISFAASVFGKQVDPGPFVEFDHAEFQDVDRDHGHHDAEPHRGAAKFQAPEVKAVEEEGDDHRKEQDDDGKRGCPELPLHGREDQLHGLLFSLDFLKEDGGDVCRGCTV